MHRASKQSAPPVLHVVSDRSELERTWRFHSSDAHSAHMVRSELMAFLNLHITDTAAVFESELIIGELLANVVEHAPGLVEIHLDWCSSIYPAVRFRDSGPGFCIADALRPADAMCEDGRGLFLIRTLAKFFSAIYLPERGAEVLVVLPVERAASGLAA